MTVYDHQRDKAAKETPNAITALFWRILLRDFKTLCILPSPSTELAYLLFAPVEIGSVLLCFFYSCGKALQYFELQQHELAR